MYRRGFWQIRTNILVIPARFLQSVDFNFPNNTEALFRGLLHVGSFSYRNNGQEIYTKNNNTSLWSLLISYHLKRCDLSQITKSRRSADCKHVGFYHDTSFKYAVSRFIYTHELKRIISMLSIYMLTLRRGRCSMVRLLLHTKPQMITSQQHTFILPYTCFLILMILKLALNRLSSLPNVSRYSPHTIPHHHYSATQHTLN